MCKDNAYINFQYQYLLSATLYQMHCKLWNTYVILTLPPSCDIGAKLPKISQIDARWEIGGVKFKIQDFFSLTNLRMVAHRGVHISIDLAFVVNLELLINHIAQQ